MTVGRLAPWYRWIEYAAFGRALEQRRFAFLDRLKAAKSILIFGEGDGRALATLLTIAPQARMDVIELSPDMIALARQRAAGVRFRCQDARTVELPAMHYDAVLTMFFLDCFTETDARLLIDRIAAALKPGGLWLVSEFAIPCAGWRRLHASVWIRVMYRFFRVATGLRAQQLPPIDHLLATAGMQRAERQETRAGMLYSEVLIRRA